ncbi:hypothetical protein BV25DRAFT_782201 [Artomyces pyxidatus]|uniref:Uncharacterized protein n=1 Tax=Artomyces pyxidatus TaxID=48021 RepID=A0ACB8SY92_9AGAM|nr:hypothetical protein BV25DRAFT_782201 [Artomyces pyxidatus]
MPSEITVDYSKFWWVLEIVKEKSVSRVLLSSNTAWSNVVALFDDWGVAVMFINTALPMDIRTFSADKFILEEAAWIHFNTRLRNAAPSSLVANAGIFQLVGSTSGANTASRIELFRQDHGDHCLHWPTSTSFYHGRYVHLREMRMSNCAHI